eukprot:GHVP01063697.1.p1 GENE.GHVP01063697.1~~GHVP01063697.1.p1  ORF type:complete len:773 (+),score=151.21 GHVP01063697.1:210-2321(+)
MEAKEFLRRTQEDAKRREEIRYRRPYAGRKDKSRKDGDSPQPDSRSEKSFRESGSSHSQEPEKEGEPHRSRSERNRSRSRSRGEDSDEEIIIPKEPEKDRTTDSHLMTLDLLEKNVIGNPETCHERTSKELEQIRLHYLGMTGEKKQIQKPSEKFRNIFNFEWDPSEDTARGDTNPLYQNRVEPQLHFGRGFRAGIDIRVQRKKNRFYDDLVKRRQAAEGHSGIDSFAPVHDMDAEDQREHWSMKTLEEMTERDWRIFREDYEIYTRGGKVPLPARNWEECNLSPELLQSIQKAGYVAPTAIQMQTIPIAMEMRDIIGIAATGSGKTAAFVLPMLTYVKKLPPMDDKVAQDGPYALVLAPARELAIQIDEECRKFASFCKCKTVAVVGGRNAESQAFALRLGCEIVVGTPGRVRDCLEKAYTVLSQCNYVVLDEADRMINLGFEETVNFILDQIPATYMKPANEVEMEQMIQALKETPGYRPFRVTHMFSATMPAQVEALSKKYLRHPVFISIGDPGSGKQSIEQLVEFVTEPKKKQKLEEVLATAEAPIIVFVNQKKVADIISKSLNKSGFNAVSLHGGKSQDTREESLTLFKASQVDVLVATDVAGRGIDVEGVQLVVNFDMPKDIEGYTHRIGRTGRAGKKGLAISFLTEEDSPVFYDLKQFLLSTNNLVPSELAHHPAAKTKPGSIGAPDVRGKPQIFF